MSPFLKSLYSARIYISLLVLFSVVTMLVVYFSHGKLTADVVIGMNGNQSFNFIENMKMMFGKW